jgi:hypothetical protein
MSSFLLTGDSWGLGEWSQKDYSAQFPGFKSWARTHPGLQHYLEQEGHQVTNISHGGQSNKVIANLLKLHLEAQSNYDYIIWFQTDPFRDLRPYAKSSFITLTTLNELIHNGDILLNDTYTQLNSLNKTIYCIGGHSKLNVDAMQSYSNLIPMIPSVIELCLPGFIQPPISFSEWITSISKDFKDFDELTAIKKNLDLFYTEPEYKKYFWPDGIHANRYGHKIIFDKICDTLRLDKKVFL